MLPKTKRLSKELFTRVMEKGQVFHCPFFLLRVALGQGYSRFAVSVPKKVSKTAVGRNRLRRQVYSIIQSLENKIDQERLIVIVLKAEAAKLKTKELGSELEKIFVKSGIIE